MRAIVFVVAVGLAVSFGPALASDGLPDDPIERRMAVFDSAWGPEDPETLEKYLEVRHAIKPLYEKYRSSLTQYALREASTQSTLGPILMSVTITRKNLEEELTARDLTFADYQRLTVLVFGRWLRAASEEEPPEKRVLRTLQEMQIGLERQLEHRPFDEEQRANVQDRVASIRHQASFLVPYAHMDKTQVLEGIDPETRAWLEERRAELIELDFGIFDTLAPQRPRPAERDPQPDPA